MKNGRSQSRKEYLEAALEQLEETARKAESDCSYVAAVRAKTEAIRIQAELVQLAETGRRKAPPKSAAAQKREIVLEVRRMRLAASEAGSFVAAANLLKLEREMVAQQEVDAAEAEKAKMSHLDEGGLVGELLHAIRALPRDVQRALAAAITRDDPDDAAPVH